MNSGEQLLCDFCSRPVLKGHCNLVIGKPVAVELVGSGGSVGINHDAQWCTCGYCNDLIKLNAWELLIRRVMMSLGAPGDKPMELLIRATYSKAFQGDLVTKFMSENFSCNPGAIVL